ncbi:hypothetical protein AB0O20_06385 [Streptomyces kronopolitis]|uniref:hypothetical protein n=1 Tax=Streptomyces kronopolitis TaxID=1612435 RepID=UPI0034485661
MAPQYFRTGYTVVEAVQYGLAEYADSPWAIRGREVPQWFVDAAGNDLIVPEFGGEDCWYLRVSTANGSLRVGPDDWIARDARGVLRVITSAAMSKDYRPEPNSDEVA